ncbi:MAG: SDR family oxidoreductase [Paracoccaceae bacterium]|nr:SDR family oxidoreductase [Paracoccaceae bacterium]
MSKSIIITGASSGIGKATAEVFLADGWTVGLLARRAELLEDIAAGHARAIPLPADVTHEEAVETRFNEFISETGRLDALFNNAGMFGPPTTIDNIALADWQAVVNLNLTGMFLAARAAFTQMRKQDPRGGRIINNGSISAHVPRETSLCYTTTKHAVTGMTRSLSLDGRDLDIACSQIDIGNAETDMVAETNARMVAEGKEPNPVMDVKHAANMVLHMANLPLEANVLFATVMANKMPFIGRG